MAAVLGLIIGVVIGVFVRPDIPIALQPYLPIMVLAALDALLGLEIGVLHGRQIVFEPGKALEQRLRVRAFAARGTTGNQNHHCGSTS